jgi:hypothetical protein
VGCAGSIPAPFESILASGGEATAQGAFSIRSRDPPAAPRREPSRCHAAQSMPVHVTNGANPDYWLINSLLTNQTSGARSRDRACCCTRARAGTSARIAKQMDGDGLLLLTD